LFSALVLHTPLLHSFSRPSPPPPPPPPSFPTRRSSDLPAGAGRWLVGRDRHQRHGDQAARQPARDPRRGPHHARDEVRVAERGRSEEHTSELQSRFDLVCRLLLEKKKKKTKLC